MHDPEITIAIRCPTALRDRLAAAAKAEALTMSAAWRQAALRYVEAHEAKTGEMSS